MRRRIFPKPYATIAISMGTAMIGCDGSNTMMGSSNDSRAIWRSATTVSPITVTDLSNGFAGAANAISATGLIVGSLQDGRRGWWQSPSSAFSAIDNGYVYGGNGFGDVGSGATVLLTTSGSPPFTVVNLPLPPGVTANSVVTRDLNDSRAVVASSYPRAWRWESPTSPPTELLPGTHPYPVEQVFPEGISNSGTVAGWVVLSLGKNRTKDAAVVWNGSSVATTLPAPTGSVSTIASNVNDAGTVSGHWSNGKRWSPIRWTPNGAGGYTVAVLDLDVGGANGPTGIDECSRITGGSPKGAWVWDPTSGVTVLPSIGGSGLQGWSRSISRNGEMAGSSSSGTGRSAAMRPTLWRGLAPCP